MNQIIFFIACGKITGWEVNADNHIVSANWFCFFFWVYFFWFMSFENEDKGSKTKLACVGGGAQIPF